jgi:hypothetical protein
MRKGDAARAQGSLTWTAHRWIATQRKPRQHSGVAVGLALREPALSGNSVALAALAVMFIVAMMARSVIVTGRFECPMSLNDWQLSSVRFATPGSRFPAAGKVTMRAASSGGSGTRNCANTRHGTAARKPSLKSGGGFLTRRFCNPPQRGKVGRVRVQ